MISKEEIDTLASELQVNASDVQRDYVHGWILKTLYGQSALASELTLKGGNALRKGYFTNSRYSADLDFSTPSAGQSPVSPCRMEVCMPLGET